jgi:broad specificity phosphatase PhoE
MSRYRAIILGLAGLLAGFLPVWASAANESEDALWTALKQGGHIALMRHALAPGTGDPATFRLDDCSTQRNLSKEGREQARRIGQTFRERNIVIARVLSSRWCRCLETARLLDLGSVEPFPVLDSFFRQRNKGPRQTAALREFLATQGSGPSLVMVTHQVNITALTDIFPRSGEIVVIRPLPEGNLTVLGRLSP